MLSLHLTTTLYWSWKCKVNTITAHLTSFSFPIVISRNNSYEFSVNGGELFDRVVDENYILTELAVVMIVCQLCEAISYIHSKNIVHLDIKVIATLS